MPLPVLNTFHVYRPPSPSSTSPSSSNPSPLSVAQSPQLRWLPTVSPHSSCATSPAYSEPNIPSPEQTNLFLPTSGSHQPPTTHATASGSEPPAASTRKSRRKGKARKQFTAIDSQQTPLSFPHVCTCGNTLGTPETLKRHLKSSSSHKDSHIQCPGCSSFFSRIDSLKRHLKSTSGKCCRRKQICSSSAPSTSAQMQPAPSRYQDGPEYQPLLSTFPHSTAPVQMSHRPMIVPSQSYMTPQQPALSPLAEPSLGLLSQHLFLPRNPVMGRRDLEVPAQPAYPADAYLWGPITPPISRNFSAPPDASAAPHSVNQHTAVARQTYHYPEVDAGGSSYISPPGGYYHSDAAFTAPSYPLQDNLAHVNGLDDSVFAAASGPAGLHETAAAATSGFPGERKQTEYGELLQYGPVDPHFSAPVRLPLNPHFPGAFYHNSMCTPSLDLPRTADHR